MAVLRNAFITAFIHLLVLTRLPAEEAYKVEVYPRHHWLGNEAHLHIPSKPPVGLLVFLPPGGIHGLSGAQLPKILEANHVMTITVAPQRDRLFTGDAILKELDDLVRGLVEQYEVPPGRIAVGGFSAGGIGAVRYAQFCLKHEGTNDRLAAVFAVDSPLDFERWFNATELYLGRLSLAGRELAEDKSVLNALRKAFGGSPTEVLDAYRRQSAISTNIPDGGNARLLKDTPIRIYIEPDVKWRVENWNRDASTFNLIDATALINILRLMGNQEAELITTHGRGYRPNGSRNPHSWSIVDERDLTRWLTDRLRAPKTE